MRLSEFLFAPSRWRSSPALGPWQAVVAVIGVFVGGKLAAFLATQAIYGDIRTVMPTPRAGGLIANEAALVAMMIWLLTAQAAMVALALAVAGLCAQGARPLLRLHAPEGGAWAYVWATLVLAIAVVVVNLVVLIVRPADLLEDLQLYIRLVRSSAAIPTALAVGIGAPLSEELMFRGLLLPALACSRLGFARAAIVATGLWTALHWGYSIIGLFEVAIFGLLLSWLLWRTGSLRVPLFCHALYNGLLLLGLWLLAPG